MKRVLVVGPPRSGTSVVARILHEKLGVCMGHRLVPGNQGNTKGFYEDATLVTAAMSHKPKKIDRALNEVHPHCKIQGMKSPELAFTDLNLLNADLILWTRRDLIHVGKSLFRTHRPLLPDVSRGFKLAAEYEVAIGTQLLKSSYRWVPIPMTPRWREKNLENVLRIILVNASVV